MFCFGITYSSEEKDTKNAKIMAAVFALLTLLFVCGGGLGVAAMAADSERQGMQAAQMAFGPGCCAISGLMMALISIFAFPRNKIAQLIAPIIAGILAGGCGGVGIVVFFETIWRSL